MLHGLADASQPFVCPPHATASDFFCPFFFLLGLNSVSRSATPPLPSCCSAHFDFPQPTSDAGSPFIMLLRFGGEGVHLTASEDGRYGGAGGCIGNSCTTRMALFLGRDGNGRHHFCIGLVTKVLQRYWEACLTFGGRQIPSAILVQFSCYERRTLLLFLLFFSDLFSSPYTLAVGFGHSGRQQAK
jgi:hypothetical protein